MNPIRFAAHGVHVLYGVVEAVRSVSFTVKPGASLALIGHNGAGKSSTLLAVAGCLPPRTCGGSLHRETAGGAAESVSLDSQRAPWVSIVPEREKVFSLLTVQENLDASCNRDPNARIRPDDVYELMPRLAQRRATLAGNLSGGEQQMLAIGSALLSSPQLLLVDEPTLGLAVPAIEDICEKLRTLRAHLGLAMVVAIAESRWVRSLADEAVVVERGEVMTEPMPCRAGIEDELDRLLAGGTPSAIAKESVHA